MIDRDDRRRMRGLAEAEKALGDHRRGKIWAIVDDRLAADFRQRPGRGGEVGAELGVECVRALQQEGEGPLRDVSAQAALEGLTRKFMRDCIAFAA